MTTAAQNVGAFAACFKAFGEGRLVAIYPEGTTHAEARDEGELLLSVRLLEQMPVTYLALAALGRSRTHDTRHRDRA